MRGVLLGALAVLLAGCGGCADVGCSHPLSLGLTFPDTSPQQPVSGVVAYDGEQRFISCPSADEPCDVSCGNEACDVNDRDIEVFRVPGGLELAIGHMSERPRDGESSCRGAESITLTVTRGRASFDDVELEIEYEPNDEYGGPGCGHADLRVTREVALVGP